MAGFDVTVTPTVTNGAYSAGDIMGGLLTFPCGTNGTLLINEVQVALKAAVTPSLTLVLFTADPAATTQTDNAAYSLNAGDVFKVRAAIPVTTLYDHGTPNTYRSGAINLIATPASGDKLYGLLIDGTGVTLTSTSDVQVRLSGVSA
jgi:hypothetical protein